MFHQFGEEELLVFENPKNLSYIRQNGKILSTLCEIYEQKMTTYMKSVPHIAPTLYELSIRHNKIKTVLRTQLKCFIDAANDKSNQYFLIFDKNIDDIFSSLIEKNKIEYEKCQLAFIIGWKCNVNKPNYDIESFDNRF